MLTAFHLLSDQQGLVASAPDNTGVGVGLTYFGLHPPGQPPVDPTSPGSCTASDYARPDVPIDLLPDVRTAIDVSLSLHTTPGGGTPTQPALEGAMQYASSWAAAHPARNTIIVLATDGEPQGCTGNDVNTVSVVAAAGAAANPPVNTYVIGVGSSTNLQALNQIAQAGSPNPAYWVDSGNSQQFLSALLHIERSARGCDLSIPPGPPGVTFDFSRLNILHTPNGGTEAFIYHVNGQAECRADTGGWYVERDAQGTPTRIKFCPSSCQAMVTGGGKVDLAFGCAPKRPPP